MSTISFKKIQTRNHKNYKINIEQYSSAMEVVADCKKRPITNNRFHDMSTHEINDWYGVKSYDEALELLNNGYQPIVEQLKGLSKIKANGETKRIQFENDIQGFMPIVPLAMMGVPNSMINMTMKPIKCKVIDVYYDITAECGYSSDDIIKAGAKLVGTILELEKQGYRFNLYAVQGYAGSHDADMLAVKIKSSDKPLDLRRISFPLCHTAFFRVIGFDWYSKFPKATYRSGYGYSFVQEFGTEFKELGKQLFGDNAVVIACRKLINNNNIDSIKEALICSM